MKKISKNYVPDTSAVIEKVLSAKLKGKKITKGSILIPHAVVAELENQANRGREIGFIGLEEINEIRTFIEKKKDITLDFIGDRPTELQIKLAKSGEIDAYIRELATEHKAVLITADLVQAESGKALGVEVEHIEVVKYKKALSLEKFLDNKTMSLHLKAGHPMMAKRGAPGKWKLETISKHKLTPEELQEYAKEIAEKVRLDPKSYTEITKKATSVVQYKNLRIVIVRPPVADAWEITVVHPLKKLHLEEYKLPEALEKRVQEQARGIVICGETGSGKSTFTQAVAEWYVKAGRVVKTVESPRDLQLPEAVTQYSKNLAASGEIHDILFLSRPDNILFDEMRTTPDFELYTDLRLGGSDVLGVLHAAEPIDGVQRFISRTEVGMIPNIVDTVIFVESGKIKKVLVLQLLVKTPTGMTESDLARPVIEIRDHQTNSLEYEIYSYGEQTVVIPVKGSEKTASGALKLAERQLEKVFAKIAGDAKAEVQSQKKAIVYVPDNKIAKVIGSNGKNIMELEDELGMHIEVRELKETKRPIDFSMEEDKKNIVIFAEPGRSVELFVGGVFVISGITSKKGLIKLHKKSIQGRKVLEGLQKKRKIEVLA